MGIRGAGCKWCAQGNCWGCKESGKSGGKSGGKAAGVRIPAGMMLVKIGKGKGKGKGNGGGCKWCAQGNCWGCKTSGGKSGGKSSSKGGSWLYIPDASSSKGKGKKGKDVSWNKTMDKLAKFSADKKVWVGGLAKDVTWKTLEKHFEETCGVKPKCTEIMSKGTGCCAFENEGDAQSAIGAMNGSELAGQAIEVDVWTEKEKKEGAEERPKRKFGAAFVKKERVKREPVDASLKVWIGGLAAKTAANTLKKLFTDNGCAPASCELMKRGTACAVFKDEGEASSAIGVMNGQEVDGKAIEVDVWTKPEEKEKPAKKAKTE